jgi:hypothetical protein
MPDFSPASCPTPSLGSGCPSPGVITVPGVDNPFIRCVNPCSLEMAWPTGVWSPTGFNKFVYTASNRRSHDWPSCRPNIVGSPAFAGEDTVNTNIFPQAGQVPWYVLPSFGIGPCPGVKQYNDASIYVSPFNLVCLSAPFVSGFIRTGGTRSHTISATVERNGSPRPDDEPFPTRQEFALRFICPLEG